MAGLAGGGEMRPGFLGNVNLVFLTYAANAILAFGAAVLVARALGPEGRGVYALFLLSASITQAVLSLGMGVSAVYYLGKRTYPLSRIVQQMRRTQQTARYIASLGPFFVGKTVWQSPLVR